MVIVFVAGAPSNDCINSSCIELPSSLIVPLMVECTFLPFISTSCMSTVHFLSPSILLVEVMQPPMLSHHKPLYSLAVLSHHSVPCPWKAPMDPFALKFCSTENPPGPFVTTMLPLSVPPLPQGPGSVFTVADQVPNIP